VKVRVGFDVRRIHGSCPKMGARVAFLSDADATPQLRPAGAALARRAVLVPEGAVQRNGDTGVVFVVADGNVEKRTVRLGERSAAGQIVLSGLSSGTRVAIGDFCAPYRWHRRPNRKLKALAAPPLGVRVMAALVSIKQVYKSYVRGKQRVEFCTARSRGGEGRVPPLMGPSGSGKSTLLNLIVASTGPTAAEITVAGQRIDQLSSGQTRKVARAARRLRVPVSTTCCRC